MIAEAGRTPLPADESRCEGPGHVAEAWQPVRCFLPETLVDEAGWGGLLSLVAGLPRLAMNSVFGFESRLGEPRLAADFHLLVQLATPLADWFRRFRGAAAAGRLLKRLGDREFPLADRVRNIILEYDLVDASPAGPPPEPGLFLTRLDMKPSVADTDTLLRAVLDSVEWPEDETECRAVRKTVDTIPQSGRLAHLAVLPERRPRAIRLGAKVGLEELPVFLREVGWRGATPATCLAMGDLPGIRSECTIAFDIVGGRISPRLSLEFFHEQRIPSTPPGAWRGFIDRLVDEGLCLPDKARGLHASFMPCQGFDGNGFWTVRGGIHHFKLAVEADGAVSAKGYLVVFYLRC